MAKMKATPRTYAQAAEYLAGRDSVKLGNNTWLEMHAKEGTGYAPFVAVRLHGTDIVKFWESGRVTLHTGGYYTVTTKDRINQFIAGRVLQKYYQWFFKYATANYPVVFVEGMNVA